MSGTPDIDAVATVLREVRIMKADPTEAEIVTACEEVLGRAGHRVIREYRLGFMNRIDLVLPGPFTALGVECKKTKPTRNNAIRQITRYLRHRYLHGVVFVLPRSIDLPAEIDGRPVRIVSLNAAWGIA